jgi:hypothetical protein
MLSACTQQLNGYAPDRFRAVCQANLSIDAEAADLALDCARRFELIYCARALPAAARTSMRSHHRYCVDLYML